MPVIRNSVDLAQNGSYVQLLETQHNCTVGIQTDPGNAAGATIRVDASWDGTNYYDGIALQDPAAAIGAAFLTQLVGPSVVGTTQDRVFGAVSIRIFRTDGSGGACKVALSFTSN